MSIVSLLATIYNTCAWAFNTTLENWWNTCPTGSRWIVVALFVWAIYEWGKRDGRRAVLKKLREREHRARKSA